MIEIYQESIRLINFPFSLVVLLVVIYWAFAIVGVLDLDVLNFDLEGASPDLHVDGGDADLHIESGHGAAHHIAGFLHVGEAPVTVILSLLSAFMWAISMTSNYYFNKGDSIWLGLAFLIPNFLVSITATGIAVIPVAAIFRKLNDNENVRKDVIGDIGTVLTSKVDHESGQIEISTGGAPITVNARTVGNEKVLLKGQNAVAARKTDQGT